MADPNSIRSLVHDIVSALVDDMDQVSVEEIKRPDGITFRVRVSPDDVGRVIGKQGRNARSIRQLLVAASVPARTTLSLEVLE